MAEQNDNRQECQRVAYDPKTLERNAHATEGLVFGIISLATVLLPMLFLWITTKVDSGYSGPNYSLFIFGLILCALSIVGFPVSIIGFIRSIKGMFGDKKGTSIVGVILTLIAFCLCIAGLVIGMVELDNF